MASLQENAVLGGGCFWCLDAIYRRVSGVVKSTSGYAGGGSKNPSYEEVCSGTSGHAEVVQIEFDPEIISFENLLEIFWHIHDPTTLNRQGGDIGTQYRSVIFYISEDQKMVAEKSKKDLEAPGIFKNPVVTEIKPLVEFFAAEDYHQNFYDMNRMAHPYCMAVIDPKVKKFIHEYSDFLNKPESIR
jgi:peptide-methionine (S)-S-oxide reductase